MIEVTDLVKTYGDTTAVDGLSFTVRPGVPHVFQGFAAILDNAAEFIIRSWSRVDGTS